MPTLYEHEGVCVELGERSVALRVLGPHVCASHAPYGGGLRAARTVAIHETRNDELTPDVDAIALLAQRMEAIDARGVGMWTSRRVASAAVLAADAAGEPELRAVALVTAGLSNAVHVGDTPGPLAGWGTINIACHVSVALTPVALLEALAIVVEARTAAVLEARVGSRRSDRSATGTGTDCVAVLAPESTPWRGQPAGYAGKHTAVGHVIGEAVFRVVQRAVANWKREVER